MGLWYKYLTGVFSKWLPSMIAKFKQITDDFDSKHTKLPWKWRRLIMVQHAVFTALSKKKLRASEVHDFNLSVTCIVFHIVTLSHTLSNVHYDLFSLYHTNTKNSVHCSEH